MDLEPYPIETKLLIGTPTLFREFVRYVESSGPKPSEYEPRIPGTEYGSFHKWKVCENSLIK